MIESMAGDHSLHKKSPTITIRGSGGEGDKVAAEARE